MLRTRLLAVLVAFAVLLPSTAMASVVYHCSMTGRTGPSCCCGSRGTTVSHDVKAPQIERAACCTAERVESTTLPAVDQRSGAEIPPAVLLSVPVGIPVSRTPVPEVFLLERRSRAPPGLGPPLFIKHCSLLY